MDWYLTGDDPAAASALRRHIRDYLERHSAGGPQIDDAELIVQEVIANSIEHAAGPVWVQLSWLDQQPELVVRDLGTGFTLPAGMSGLPIPAQQLPAPPKAPSPSPAPSVPDLFAEGGRGLFLVTQLAPAFEVAGRRGGGSQVHVRLPVNRSASRSIDPLRPITEALPALEEASPAGGFNRESFLRALVVQLAQAIEHTSGPDAGEDVVAQVGVAVGGQMEAEYRAARHLIDRLTPQQLAECFVRLKHAIDGQFHIIEITDDHIVLGNTRCPFGDAVRKSPALCRMTSSVFGGIAAHNHDRGAAVILEERIAVGDPGCRVVVYLGDAPDSARSFAHRYTSPDKPVQSS